MGSFQDIDGNIMYLVGVCEVGTCGAHTEMADSLEMGSTLSGSTCNGASRSDDSIGPLKDTCGNENPTVTIDAGSNDFKILHCSRAFAGLWGSDPCGQSLLQYISNSQVFFEEVQENVNAIITEAESDETFDMGKITIITAGMASLGAQLKAKCSMCFDPSYGDPCENDTDLIPVQLALKKAKKCVNRQAATPTLPKPVTTGHDLALS